MQAKVSLSLSLVHGIIRLRPERSGQKRSLGARKLAVDYRRSVVGCAKVLEATHDSKPLARSRDC